MQTVDRLAGLAAGGTSDSGSSIAWTVAATIVALFFATAAAQAGSADCTLRRVASIPARVSSAAELLVSGSVDDVPADLVLDTGLGFSALSRAFVLRVGLPIERLHPTSLAATHWQLAARLAAPSDSKELYGINGAGLTEQTRVPSLRLGEAHSDYDAFGVTPTGSDGSDGRPVGVFGADYLSQYDVEIDPGDGKVNLFDRDHCAGRLVYWSSVFGRQPIEVDPDSHLISTEVELDGKTLRALIDTGAPATTLPLATLRQVFGRDPNGADFTPGPVMTGVDGNAVPTYLTRFDRLKIGDILVHRPRLTIADLHSVREAETGSHIARTVMPDLIIGMSVLRRLRIMISYRESALYYTPVVTALN